VAAISGMHFRLMIAALAHVENPILHGAPAEWPREMSDEERVSESDCDNRNSFFCNPKVADTSSRDL